jgi:Transposase, Mutator family
MSRECWSEEEDLRAAEDACSPAAARLAAGRRFERPLLKTVGAALLINIVPLQGYAQNAASTSQNDQTQAVSGDRAPIVIVPSRRVVAPAAPPQPPAFHPDTDDDQNVSSGFREPNGFEALYRGSHFGGLHPRHQQGLFGVAPSRLLPGACGLKGIPQQRANAEQRCLSALAYVLSPPPATRGVLPRYLPTVSPKDAQPIPLVAAAKLPPRPAWRQAGCARRAQVHQGRRRDGAQRRLAELPRPLHAQRAGSCRQERSARRLLFHRHGLCPRPCGGGPGAMAPRRRPTRSKLPKLAAFLDEAETDVVANMTLPTQHRTKPHSINPIERLNGETKRRTEVVGIFPNEDAIVRLVGAILLQQNVEWPVQRAHYMTPENHRTFER